MMITDGQLFYEMSTGAGVLSTAPVTIMLCSGSVPASFEAVVAAMRTVTSNTRVFTASTVNTWLTNNAAGKLVDVMYNNVPETLTKAGQIKFALSSATDLPTVTTSGTPKWGILFCHIDSVTYTGSATARHAYFFTVGTEESGADVVLPEPNVVAGQIIKFNDIKIPVGGVIL